MIEAEPLTFRRLVQITAVSLLVGAALVYVVFQARYVLIGPRIVLLNDSAIIQANRQITLSGSTHNISRLWLNDRPIYTDPQGNFNEALVLENGYTIATLRASDRYGRTTTISREFVYNPMTLLP